MLDYSTWTATEIISALNHAPQPTVLVEGVEDMAIYRDIKKMRPHLPFQWQALGGRKKVLEVFARRTEIRPKVAFLVDNDMWLFAPYTAPAEDAALLRTWGYSIENDLYAAGGYVVDYQLTAVEHTNKAQLLRSLSAWFASEVRKYRTGKASELKIQYTSLNDPQVIAKGSFVISEAFLQNADYIEPSDAELQEITAEQYRRLRGKFLLQAYFKLFNERKPQDGDKPLTYTPTHLRSQMLGAGLNDANANPLKHTLQRLESFFSV